MKRPKAITSYLPVDLDAPPPPRRAPVGGVLSPEDLARIEEQRQHGYEEHASYPLKLEYPLCGLCGQVAIHCPHPGVHALAPGEAFRGSK